MNAVVESSENPQVDRLREILDSGAMRSAQKLLNTLNPAEVAHLLESLPREQRDIIWHMLPDEMSGETLLEVSGQHSVRTDQRHEPRRLARDH